MQAPMTAMGVSRMGDWQVSWDQGMGDDQGVIMLCNVAGNFREVWFIEEIPNASALDRQAQWQSLLEKELERLREFANADAAKNWSPELERLDFREAWTGRLVGFVNREAGSQKCPFCGEALTVDWVNRLPTPPHRVAPRLQVWSCSCGFEWRRSHE